MPKIEHNAPRFQYRVFWKRDIDGVAYQSHDITDWEVGRYVIENQPTFEQYRIKVIAMNEKGEANVAPEEVIGYSGEDHPLEAPTNFTLLKIQGPKTAILSWNPVDKKKVNGHLRGYKIRTWSDNSNNYNEIQVQGFVTKALVDSLDPYTRNFAEVFVYNGKYNGPVSERLSFVTPEGVPEDMSFLEAHPLGSRPSADPKEAAVSAFLLTWKPPGKPNGILTGYNIYYRPLIEGTTNARSPRKPQITGGNILSCKLSGLKEDTTYVIYISALTSAGASKEFFIEGTTASEAAGSKPGVPTFTWEPIRSVDPDNNLIGVRIQWLPARGPNINPGSHFSVKYKRQGEPTFREEGPILTEDFVNINGLDAGESYDFLVTSVDGNYYVDSESQLVNFDGPKRVKENVANAGWFIGMMLAIAILLLVLIIVCIIKRNRGGKYAVHEREQANGRHDYPDEGGFHEYSQP